MNKPIAQTAYLTIAADPMSVRHGLQSLFALAPLICLSEDCRGTAEIVMAEALNNIVEHAYADSQDGAGEIEISVGLDSDGLECCIADRGRAMPNLQLPAGAPHLLTDDSDLPEGGFGWFLIRSLVQDLQYSRQDNQNQLRFRVADGQFIS